LILDEEVTAVVMAIVMVVGVFTLSQTVFADRVVGPFSELAVLGPNLKIGDYPKEIVAGEEYVLYLYLGSHEGQVMYYRVLMKLGDRGNVINETHPLETEALASFDVVLQHGDNSTIPIIVRLDEPGLDRRLVFEMHTYDSGVGEFVYHQRFCQLWFNVTRHTG